MTRKVEGENSEDLLTSITGNSGGPEELLAMAKGLSPRLAEDEMVDDSNESQENGKENSEEPKPQEEWTETFTTNEMIDDPVRMYLREIGRVSLLNAKEERALARQMECEKSVKSLDKTLTSPEGRSPQAWQMVIHSLNTIVESEQLLESIRNYAKSKDAQEEIVGEIYDEHDVAEQSISVDRDGRIAIDGGCSVSDLLDWLDLEKVLETEQYDTVAGFIIGELGRIPEEGDRVSLGTVTIEVVELTDRRVTRVQIHGISEEDLVKLREKSVL